MSSYCVFKKFNVYCTLIFCLPFYQHPVRWETSADGSRWIGHMILKKTVLEGTGADNSGAILGIA